ncbi:hypothetical protein ACN47E_000084 [Coniothyrium glycines]
MAQLLSRRVSEMTTGAGPTSGLAAKGGRTSKAITHRRTASFKPKVAFESQAWTASSSQPRVITKSASTIASKRASSNPTTGKPVTKGQSRFASLFISFLAVSPAAIEYEAADEATMEAAQRVATQPTKPNEAVKRVAGGVKQSEIRKTRWKRFKYELG